MQERMISDICAQLTNLRIPFSSDNRTNIVINTEFLDASWSSGTKKISYESSILADESKQTVFMFEKTVNTGGGFSGGTNSESTFQSGTTLFRKVKSVQYGPDGKAFEFTLDLGAIPKAVKETAVRNGWKFKTVLNRDKASAKPNSQPQGVYMPSVQPNIQPQDGYIPPVQTYAAQQQTGYIPPNQPPVSRFCMSCGTPLNTDTVFCPNCGTRTGMQISQPPIQPPPIPSFSPPVQPSEPQLQGVYAPLSQYQQPQYQTKQKQAGLKPKKIKPVFIIAFSILSLITVFMFALSGSSIIGWIISILVLIATISLLRTFSGKGALPGFLMLIVSLVLIFLTYAFTLPESSGSSTPNKDIGTVESTDAVSDENTGTVLDNSTSISATDSIFMVDRLSIDSQPIIKNTGTFGNSPCSLSVRTRFIVDINANMDYVINGKATQGDISIASATLSVTPENIQNGTVVTFIYKGSDNMPFNPETLSSQALNSPFQLPVFNTYDEADQAEESGASPYILSLVKNTTSVQLRFGTGLLDITPEENVEDYNVYMKNAIDKAASNGLNANTLRYKVHVIITLVTVTGKTQIIEFTREVMPEGHDMLTLTPGGAQYLEDHQSDKTQVAEDMYSKPAE